MVKAVQVAAYVNSLVGKGVDMDGAYGYQCMDLTIHIMKKYFGWWPTGNAIHLKSQAIPAGFKRMAISHASQIRQGDVLIWAHGAYAAYGHTAIATENGRANNRFVSVDQNWVNSNLSRGSVAAPVLHDMTGVWGVIRPPYESGNSGGATKPPPVKPPVGIFVWKNGRFTLTVSAINVRDQPSRQGAVVATYTRGQSFNYDGYIITDAHVWLSYIASSGKRRYVACGPYDGNPKNVWGTGF